MNHTYVLQIETEREKKYNNVKVTMEQTYYLRYSININEVINETKESFASLDKLRMQTITLFKQDNFGRREIVESYRVLERNWNGDYTYICRFNATKQSYNIDYPETITKSKKENNDKVLELVLQILSNGINLYFQDLNPIT
jgi:hypothetical protein